MLAEIVRSSFITGRGDPSELFSHICGAEIFNPFQDLWPLWIANDLFRENHDEAWYDKLPCENNSLITTRQIILDIICIN